MKQKIFKPDYQNSLVSLSNSILKHYGLPARHQTLPELDAALAEKNPRTVILLVLDGMGIDMLEHNLPENSFLRSHVIKPISSVYPPTTAAATTSIYSGLPPLEHGWAGWQCYFEEYGRCVELFRNFDYYTQQQLSTPSPEQIMGFKRLNEQIAESGAAEGYGVAQPWGNFEVKSFDDICRILEKLSRKDEKKFVLAYWKNPDGIMHKTGCYSEETKNCITSLDAKLEALYQALEDAMLIVTADHGLLDIKDSVLLNEIKELDDCLRLPPAVEPRTIAFYVKPGREAEFESLFRERFGQDYILLKTEDYIAEGYAGTGRIHPRFRGFMGNYVALAVGDIIIQYQTPNGVEPVDFVAHHAGLSEKEMLVPLIVCEKQ